MSGEQTQKEVITTDPVTDYLDRPPQRWKHEFQKASGSREMIEDRDGEWVKFEDMDLYMFEGGQLMLRLMRSHHELLEALKELLASQIAIMPPFEAGKDAQDAWSDRRAKARNDAAYAIDKAEGRS